MIRIPPPDSLLDFLQVDGRCSPLLAEHAPEAVDGHSIYDRLFCVKDNPRVLEKKGRPEWQGGES
jgi:hypothetical protein